MVKNLKFDPWHCHIKLFNHLFYTFFRELFTLWTCQRMDILQGVKMEQPNYGMLISDLSLPLISLQLKMAIKVCCLYLIHDSWEGSYLKFPKGCVFLCWSSTKLGLMCHAQGHKSVTLVGLEPLAPLSWAKHSTTEPLCSLRSMT